MNVSAIIPAYNEEKTIDNVLKVLNSSSLVDEIIVVSDGSEDATADSAQEYNSVITIDLLHNRGKGGAVIAGLKRSKNDIILILDADLIGLTEQHVQQLLKPVSKGETKMAIGVFEKGRVATDFAQKVAPFLSGQRAMKRELLENISDLDLTRFGIEVALHQYVDEHNIPTVEVQLPDLSHVMKEEKLGLWKGIWARAIMYFEIFKYVLRVDSLTKKNK